MPEKTLYETKLSLEDGPCDVIGKCLRGLNLTRQDLAERAGISVSAVEAILSESADVKSPDVQQALEKIAVVLNLRAEALIHLATGAWQSPDVVPVSGLQMFTTPFADMTVNAYLVSDPQSGLTASFDTGSRCQVMLDAIQQQRLKLSHALITHTHLDHIQDLPVLLQAGATGYGSALDNPLGLKPLRHQDGLILGDLRIRVLATPGHTPGGLSYFVEGLSKPLVVVGDALFAGSMGGAPYAFAEARQMVASRILSLPPETIICPGHGPLTAVGHERLNNPFFPEF